MLLEKYLIQQAPLPEKESIIKTNIYDEDKLGLEQLKQTTLKQKSI